MTTQSEIINFALWMFNRQTDAEKLNGQTIQLNDIGFNHPDSMMLSSLLTCLSDKVPYSQKELNKIAFNILKPRLLKYQKQYNEYCRTKKA